MFDSNIVNINQNKYYVYGLFDENGIPFYIGKGKGNRINNHTKPSLLKSRSKKNTKIKYLLDTYGFVRKDILCYFDNESSAFSFEVYLINYYGIITKGGILTNVVDYIGYPRKNFTITKPCMQKATDQQIYFAFDQWSRGEWLLEKCANYLGMKSSTVSNIFNRHKRKYLNLPSKQVKSSHHSYSTVFEVLIDRFINKRSYDYISGKFVIPKTTISRMCKLQTDVSLLVYTSTEFKVLMEGSGNGTSDEVAGSDNSVSNNARDTV